MSQKAINAECYRRGGYPRGYPSGNAVRSPSTCNDAVNRNMLINLLAMPGNLHVTRIPHNLSYREKRATNSYKFYELAETLGFFAYINRVIVIQILQGAPIYRVLEHIVSLRETKLCKRGLTRVCLVLI
jgi:hypothetical protein